jgi:hypothetical protein
MHTGEYVPGGVVLRVPTSSVEMVASPTFTMKVRFLFKE